MTVEEIDLDGLSGDWLLGTARLRATAAEGSAVFVGVASADDVADYLDGVAHSEIVELDGIEYVEHAGGAPEQAPEEADIWTVQASGPGTQTVTWKPTAGDWAVVVMNQDASAGVDVRADVGGDRAAAAERGAVAPDRRSRQRRGRCARAVARPGRRPAQSGRCSMSIVAPPRREAGRLPAVTPGTAAVVRRLHAVSPAEDVDLVLEHISPGEVVFSTHARLGQHPGAVSRGRVGATMLDFALAAAVQSVLAPGQSYRMVDLAVSTVPTSRPPRGRLEAAARVVSGGGGIVVATGHVRGEGELHATGRLVALAGR